MTTTNLAEFGNRELGMAGELLTAYSNNMGPEEFYSEGVTLMMNKYSGNVFLTNDEHQVLMMNGNDLEMFYTTPYEGHEGFADELLETFEIDGSEYWHKDDVEYLIDCDILDVEAIAKNENPNIYAALIEYGFIDDTEEVGTYV